MRRSYHFRTLVVLAFVCAVTNINSQEIDIQIPAAPNAEAFKEYVDVPVSEFTGTPNINIPLHEISEGVVKVPISLSYHAGGIRVAEEASWVGLGWSLNAGGVITRTIRDKDDFGFKYQCVEKGGYYDKFDELIGDFPADPDNLGWESYENIFGTQLSTVYIKSLIVADDVYETNGGGMQDVDELYCKIAEYDREPDIYSYNFMGYSGQFILNKQKEFVPLSNHEIKIEYEGSTQSWIFTTGDGIKFYFGDTQSSKQFTYSRNYSFYTNPPSSPDHSLELDNRYNYTADGSPLACKDSFISSWYLTKIVGPDGADILFEYNRTAEIIHPIPNFSERFEFAERITYIDCPGEEAPDLNVNGKSATLQVIEYDDVRLASIVSDYETIEFEETSDRLDVIGATRLQAITIYRDAQYYKKVLFSNNNYFVSEEIDDEHCWEYLIYNFQGYFWGAYINDDNNNKRLKLESVIVEGLNGERLPDYSFTYNPIQLPPKTSMSVDFWGYANGNADGGTRNLTLVPTYYFHDDKTLDASLQGCTTQSIIGPCSALYLRGGDRRAEESYAVAGILTDILLPTGASHSIRYELNQFKNNLDYAFSKEIDVVPICTPIDASNYSDPSAFTTTITVSESENCQNTPIYFKARWSFQNGTECETYPRVKITNSSGFSETINLYPTSGSPPSFAYSFLDDDDKPLQIPSGEPTISLPTGEYVLEIDGEECCWDQSEPCPVYFTIYLEAFQALSTEDIQTGGGLRVSSIITDVGSGTKTTDFTYENADGTSSGIVHSVPVFKEEEYMISQAATFWPNQDEAHFKIATMNSNSQTPLTNLFASATVGYSRVVKSYFGDGESFGSEELIYYNELPHRDERLYYAGIQIPYFYNRHNGDLMESSIYTSDGLMVYKKTNVYSIDFEHFDWIWSTMPYFHWTLSVGVPYYPPCDVYGVTFVYYALVPQWHQLTNVMEEFYGTDGSGPLIKTTSYTYNTSNYQTKTETVSCGSDSKTTEYFYASDIANGVDANGIDNGETNTMLSSHMTGVVLEKKINNGLGGGMKVAYASFGGLVLPSKYYRAEGTSWEPTDRIVTYDGRFPKIVKFKSDTKNTEFVWLNGLIDKKYYPEGGNGRKWDFNYNSGRHLVQIIDNAGIVSDFDYDNLWRLEWRELKNGRIREDFTYEYARTSDANKIISILNYPTPSHDYLTDVSLRTVSKYDGAGRMVSTNKEKYTQDQKDFITGQSFNGIGQVTSETDPAVGGTSRMKYEKSILNRVTEILPPATPEENAISIIHGVNGCLFTEERIDENGNSTITYKDIFRRTKKVDQEGIVTEFEYNDRDQVLFVYPPESAPPYEYTYYPNGLLWTKKVPDKSMNNTYTYAYNSEDQVQTEGLPNGTTIITRYHPTYNHLVRDKVTSGGVVISEYEYENADHYDWVSRYGTEFIETGEILSTKYKEFDDLGRYKSEIQWFLEGASSIHYQYDDADNIVIQDRTHYSGLGGGRTRYEHTYDRGLRLESTKAQITGLPGSEFYGKYTYDHRDLLTSSVIYDGLYSTSYTYHQRGWMETINGVNSTFRNGEKPNCDDGPNSGPTPPPGCAGPIVIVNVSVFYDCLALQNGSPTNIHIQMQGVNVDYADPGPTNTSSFTIPFNGGSPEELTSYPEQAELALTGEPGSGTIPNDAESQILALILNCLGEANLGTVQDPVTYNDLIALINAILQGGGQSDNSGSGGLFGMNLHYMEENTELEAPAQYNGNVAWMEWSVPYENLQQYGFMYDAHDRLTQAKYRAFEKTQCVEKNTGAYDVYIDEYDDLGNIGRLRRYGMVDVQQEVPVYGLIDNLEYKYNHGTLVNRLTGIDDHSVPNRGFQGALSESFTYDNYGNVTGQSNIGLQGGTYNFLDLPEELNFGNGTIHNYYTADGQKLMSVTDETGVGSTVHYYEDGFEYEDDELVAIYHPEGRVVFNGELETQDGTLTTYPEWVVRDHLGNTRVRFVDKDRNGEIDVYKNDVVGSELIGSYHYYPFGMEMDGEWSLQQGEEYDYQYNGKEFESDLGLKWYDYGARWYDASIGRWTSVDPLCEEDRNAMLSPYQYVGNNPVLNIDPDGQDWYRNQKSDEVHWQEGNDEIEGHDRLGAFHIIEGKAGFIIHHQNKVVGYISKASGGTMDEAQARLFQYSSTEERLGVYNPAAAEALIQTGELMQAFLALYGPGAPKGGRSPKSFNPQFGHNIVGSLKANPRLILGRSPESVAKMFREAGYRVQVLPIRSGNGTRLIIEGHPHINSIRFHNAAGRHGIEHIRVSGNNVNVKIVKGSRSSYKGDVIAEERAGTSFIFSN